MSALDLPPDAKPGIVSEHGSLRWVVDAKVDVSGTFDTHASVELGVVVA